MVKHKYKNIHLLRKKKSREIRLQVKFGGRIILSHCEKGKEIIPIMFARRTKGRVHDNIRAIFL